MEKAKKGDEEWIEHMKKLYDKDTTGWDNEQWRAWGKKCLEIQKRIYPNKSGWPAWNTCNVGKTLSRVHFKLIEKKTKEEAEENRKKMIELASGFFGLSGGSGSRKSKSTRKSTISKRNVYSDFKSWFKDSHETKKLPRSDQLYKFLDETLGPHTRYGWRNVIFRTEEGYEDSDNEVNDLDK